jgi:hypothetical protein
MGVCGNGLTAAQLSVLAAKRWMVLLCTAWLPFGPVVEQPRQVTSAAHVPLSGDQVGN